MATRTVSGTVTVVQERRFELADAAGVVHRFVLATDAGLDERDLAQCARRHARVRVRYHDAPGLLAHVAAAVEADETEDGSEAHAA